MSSPNRWLLLAASSTVVSGCGGRSNLDGESSYLDFGGLSSDTGGTQTTGGTFGLGTSTGGVGINTGGRKATGGSVGTGGTKVMWTGGARSTGGAKAIPTGGVRSTGGSSAFFPTGGTKATGGTKSTLGGSSATGGSFTAGGAPTGGSKGTGGTSGFGGTKATGGTTLLGGTSGTGGSSGTGGKGTGGSKATGGTTSSTGGSPPTGGNPGTGGSSACPTYLLANEELIDDMNDGNAAIPEVSGRRGAWSDSLVNTSGAFIYPDPSTPFFVIDTGDICRTFAVYVKGQTSIDPGSGANFGFSLGAPYDASAYSGLSFWARIEPGTDPPVRVTFPDGDTDPRGAVCSTSTADSSKTCWSHYGRRLTLTTTWTKYTIPFSSLTQDPWGYQALQFSPSTLYSVMFAIGDTATFAVWIDSVAFTK